MHFFAATDEQLLASRSPSHAGDAFAEFYRRHERGVLAFHRRRVGNAEVAADLAAATFVEALSSRHRFRWSSKGDAAAWLFGIAFHVLSRYRRDSEAESRRHLKLQQQLHGLTGDQAAEIDALTRDEPLLEALSQLPDEQREAIYAYVVAEDSYEEIAQRTEISPAAARKRVSRGLAALRSSHKENA